MLMSDQVEATTKETFASIQSPSVQATLQNTSVKLSGTAAGGAFTGSGAVLYSRDNTVYVVTAKHNLYVFAGEKDPPAWDQVLVSDFQQKVSILYDDKMQFGGVPKQTASISGITTVDLSSPQSWLYDVMILESTDAAFSTFAQANYAVQNITGSNSTFVMNESSYLGKGGTTSQVYFIQTGYGRNDELLGNGKKLPTGKPGDNISGTLQYRFPQPKANQTVTVYNQTTDGSDFYQFLNTIQLSADTNTSTAEGDSGGPLFLVRFDKPSKTWQIYLIGVTTGADMETAQILCPKPPALRVNNIATSLAYCYSNEIIY
jgi:hypothetical protein